MTHSAVPPEEQTAKGLDTGGIRLAIGLEKAEDIIRDLAFSLDQTQ
jgi:cystathionine beta-lyase/cystathionine gamma-synthase